MGDGLSVSMLTETIVSMLYYTFNTTFIIPEISNLNDPYSFMQIILFHLFSEIFQSMFRFSKLYFHFHYI